MLTPVKGFRRVGGSSGIKIKPKYTGREVVQRCMKSCNKECENGFDFFPEKNSCRFHTKQGLVLKHPSAEMHICGRFNHILKLLYM